MRVTTTLSSLLGLTIACTIDQEGLPDTGLDTSSWTCGTAPAISNLVCANDFQFAAKNTLSGADYAYYRTAALDEITYNNNMHIWEKIRLNGYTFADVSNVNLKTSILGYQFQAPFFIAPAAYAGKANSGAETNFVKAAASEGLLYVPSISSSQSIETIGSAAASGQIMFHQEYIWSDLSRLQDELSRMEAAGFKAVFLTMDNAGTSGIRTRYMRYGGGAADHASSFTIDAINKIRSMTKLPVVAKGLKTAVDVKKAADIGFPAVYISNHGGRQVDLVPTAVEILLEVHRDYPEVFSKMEIYCDGGVRRADHILILLALGCRAVGLGRSPMYANVYGTSGVTKLIQILKLELQTEMANMGLADVNQWHGNTSFINTRQVELELFGSPLSDDTHVSPTVIPKPLYTGSGSSTVSSATSSTSSSSSLTSSSSNTQTSSSSASSTTSSVSSGGGGGSSSSSSSSSTTSSPSSSSTPTTLTSSTISSSTSSTSTSSAPASTVSVTCPTSNNTVYAGGPNGKQFLIECGIDHVGGDLKSQSVSSFTACINLCDSTAGCVDVSLSGSACYLKKSLGAAKAAGGIQGAKLIS
ncbi:FMN-linked oxidoreductase [Polychaeton citri CBS 116435]|uniref:FMN-linked oxidoreductase n=1 Tax=Polychaeton citri CBS 116435 TaxID=1314669 RepID=A0A9P4Q4G7_9PEZI|nr:FMN-linked oxidoreductase [Polychaeton citri CBS 116435]